MNIEPTIPCPICTAPILVRQVDLPTGEIARVYTEPLSKDDSEVLFHEHQLGDVELSIMH